MIQISEVNLRKLGVIMKFKDLIMLINDDYDYTLTVFTNDELENTVDENQDNAKLLCY